MAFYAKSFIYDDKPSEFYNLYLGELDSGGITRTPTSNDVNILSQKIFRNPVPLFYGVEQIPVLQFPLSMYSTTEITTDMFSKISAWLFGRMSYRELRICQNDMTDVYFNAIMTSPQLIRIGNIIRGLSCTVTCDAPWGWKEEQEYSISYSGSYFINNTVYIFNKSDNNYYTYPSNFAVEANAYGGEISITNVTDNNREFLYTAVAYETVTLNCNTQRISSDSRQYPLNYFTNKKWFRMLPGFNEVKIEGYIKSLNMTNEVAVKIST